MSKPIAGDIVQGIPIKTLLLRAVASPVIVRYIGEEVGKRAGDWSSSSLKIGGCLIQVFSKESASINETANPYDNDYLLHALVSKAPKKEFNQLFSNFEDEMGAMLKTQQKIGPDEGYVMRNGFAAIYMKLDNGLSVFKSLEPSRNPVFRGSVEYSLYAWGADGPDMSTKSPRLNKLYADEIAAVPKFIEGMLNDEVLNLEALENLGDISSLLAGPEIKLASYACLLDGQTFTSKKDISYS